MQVYADQGILLGSQEEAADLALKLTAAEHREVALKAALADEQAARQSDARLAAAKDAKASADLRAAAEKVQLSSPARHQTDAAPISIAHRQKAYTDAVPPWPSLQWSTFSCTRTTQSLYTAQASGNLLYCAVLCYVYRVRSCRIICRVVSCKVKLSTHT